MKRRSTAAGLAGRCWPQKLPVQFDDGAAGSSSACSISSHIATTATAGGVDVLSRVSARKFRLVLSPPTYNRFPNSFAHIFAGGRGRYYSYNGRKC
jgi:hypothetical protein